MQMGEGSGHGQFAMGKGAARSRWMEKSRESYAIPALASNKGCCAGFMRIP